MCMIDARLKALKPNRAKHMFAGVLVVAVGDFYQLPAVRDTPLFRPPRHDVNIDGFDVWRLTNQHRSANTYHNELLARMRDATDTSAMAEMLARVRQNGMPRTIGPRTAVLVATKAEAEVVGLEFLRKFAEAMDTCVLRLNIDGTITLRARRGCVLRIATMDFATGRQCAR